MQFGINNETAQSVFIEDIEFEYVDHKLIFRRGDAFHDIDCLFHSGSQVHDQWNRLYENIYTSIGVIWELYLRISVPHLKISGTFRIDQIGTTRDKDQYIVNVRAHKSDSEQTSF